GTLPATPVLGEQRRRQSIGEDAARQRSRFPAAQELLLGHAQGKLDQAPVLERIELGEAALAATEIVRIAARLALQRAHPCCPTRIAHVKGQVMSMRLGMTRIVNVLEKRWRDHRMAQPDRAAVAPREPPAAKTSRLEGGPEISLRELGGAHMPMAG